MEKEGQKSSGLSLRVLSLLTCCAGLARMAIPRTQWPAQAKFSTIFTIVVSSMMLNCQFKFDHATCCAGLARMAIPRTGQLRQNSQPVLLLFKLSVL